MDYTVESDPPYSTAKGNRDMGDKNWQVFDLEEIKAKLKGKPVPQSCRVYNWLSSGNSVTFFISVTAMCECSSRIEGLAVSVLRTNSS